MKTLFLVRHAKSSWTFDIDDHDRPLGKRGRKDVFKMGNYLLDRQVVPELCITSTASRALYTALHLCDTLKIDENCIELEEKLYHADPANILNVIRQSKSCERLAVFGHNPGFTSAANALCNHHFDNIPTCGVVGIKFDINDWSEVSFGKGNLAFAYFPKTI
ncbi:MAG: histidine phosphatase family protein [Ekhidna sp.]|nr:histidine phosphatase family protein [Ekhidna sp.]